MLLTIFQELFFAKFLDIVENPYLDSFQENVSCLKLMSLVPGFIVERNVCLCQSFMRISFARRALSLISLNGVRICLFYNSLLISSTGLRNASNFSAFVVLTLCYFSSLRDYLFLIAVQIAPNSTQFSVSSSETDSNGV